MGNDEENFELDEVILYNWMVLFFYCNIVKYNIQRIQKTLKLTNNP